MSSKRRVYPGQDQEANQPLPPQNPTFQQPVQQTPLQAQPLHQPQVIQPQPSTIQQTPNYGGPQSTSEVIPLSVDPSVQSSPTYLRMTMNCAPTSMNLLNKSAIPFGCILQPFAQPATVEDQIPLINSGVSGIVRCRRCRSYINPFVAFVENGRRWRCNLCNQTNDVPGDYFSPIDASGKREDLYQRPELHRGAVEYIASPEYMVRPPVPATYVFVIDASYSAVTSGMFSITVESIKTLLNNLPGHPRTKVAFITYDNSVHFYNLRSNLNQPQMLVVTDIDDMFLPLPDDLLVNLHESRVQVEALLSKLPKMFATNQTLGTVLGTAVKAGFDLMSKIGGKMLLFCSHLPDAGVGKLPNREDVKLLGTDKEINLLNPEDPSSNFYRTFALECSNQQISVDLFACTSTYLDLATVGSLPQFTGGELFYYPGFRGDRDSEKLYRDIARVVTRETGFEGVMRVRTSKALKVAAHFGNFFIRSTDLMALPMIDADKAYGIQLTLAENTITNKFASLQAAVLYTTSRGERRIRVLTQCLPVTSALGDLFKGADVEAVTVLTTKMAIEKALSTQLADCREALLNKCIDILTVYRAELTGQNSSTQLLLPESLKLFPLYVLALIKHVAFRSSTDTRPDVRTAALSNLRIASVSQTLASIYPRLFRLDNIADEVQSMAEITPLSLSSEKLDRNGAFLLEDGHSMYFWFGRGVSQEFVNNLFGTPSLENVDTSQLRLTSLDNPVSSRICSLIEEIRNQRSMWMPLYVVREGEPRETTFFSFFVEDRTKSVHSYYDFLINLHQRIQAKLAKR